MTYCVGSFNGHHSNEHGSEGHEAACVLFGLSLCGECAETALRQSVFHSGPSIGRVVTEDIYDVLYKMGHPPVKS